MKIGLLLVLCALAAPVHAQSIAPEFFRWQSGEFAASLRYLQYGVATPGINDIYAREVGNFIATDDVDIATLCPGYTSGSAGQSWTFFGARFLTLDNGDRKPSFYAVSYLGNAAGFHDRSGFDAIFSAREIGEVMKGASCRREEAGIADRFLARHSHSLLSHDGSYAPLSWNSLDIDGDGSGDFTFGGLLHLSTNGFRPIDDALAGSEAVFVNTREGVRLVRAREDILRIEALVDGKLKTLKQFRLEGPRVANAGYRLMSVPGASPDEDYLALRSECGLALFLVDEALRAGALRPAKCISGIAGRWAMPGASGDFDGDGVPDFWISQTMHADDLGRSPDNVRLISGALLAKARGVADIDALAVARVRGSRRYSDYDGISTTLSPIAGDIDGDGSPDLSLSGHRHMNEAGAMYVLFGKDVRPGLDLSIESPVVRKIAGPLMAQLAPPYHHWDATDWDGDGFDDIVVPADNDLRSGMNAGAVYVLSGAKISGGRRAKDGRGPR